ncbi:unnamed protein product [Cylicocyclus nassatus]|uniref:Transthyretin-like family protein n=1 Tax=Cylicocyclus nassatus TaxID=53992 RepID=A0AA36GZB8_CYLNA|nr:unnamed protein product [Cylicocyclus nassatus]
MRSLLLLLALGLCYSSVSAVMQNITAKGIAMCHKKRMPLVHVELYERDVLDPNDLLAQTYTDAQGEFKLYGEEDEVATIEPFLRISHGCMVSKPGCKRVADYEIPAHRIGSVYDMTYIPLDIAVAGESETC